MGNIRCFECKGTGSSVPDCSLCQGYRTVKAKRAYAFGWKKCDLIDLENDGYAKWAGDALDLPKDHQRPVDAKTVKRFTDEMRGRLDRLDELAGVPLLERTGNVLGE